MLTGYNTDVKREGKVFHVQTEDKGLKNPVIETLVYVGGGQIIASRQYSYAGLVAGGKVDERILSDLLDSQHRQTIRWITGGKYDPQGPPPFGSTIISERSFDEVALEFIRQQSAAEPVEVLLADEFAAKAGVSSPIRILVRSEVSNVVAVSAQVSVTLVPPGAPPVRLLAGATGADGALAGKIKIPVDAAGGSLMIEARHAGHVGSLELPIGAP